MKLIDCSTKKFPNTFAMVDNEDFDRLNAWCWYAWRNGNTLYAARSMPNKKHVHMHREILPPGGGYVDHIDHNGLNNTRTNLRIATHMQNICNGRKRTNNKSGFIGVYWHAKALKWAAQITVNGTVISLGLDRDPFAIARLRDKAAIELHGKFAALNFPDPGTPEYMGAKGAV